MTPIEQTIISAAGAEPARLTDIESWHQHIPFAFALIALIRPRKLVELGTHRGDSYCAFCQAIVENQLPTQAYAIDTWSGDEQAGEYATEILQELRQHHDPRYAGFSTLMPMLFDQAAQHFPPESIDLLHIDGLHTAEAARHDFATWHPLLSSQAVVLFHDTQVRKEGFGVWQVWAELNAIYPGFEFKHGNGLGVLLPGRQPPETLVQWSNNPDTVQHLQTIFQALGERIHCRRNLSLHQKANAELWQRVHQGESDFQQQITHYQHKIAEIHQSTSWKITKPLRLFNPWYNQP